jgi:hypothetical protein
MQVRTILTPDLLRRYEKRQADDCLMRAGLENLVKCPFCQLQVEVPEEQRILKCPRPSCARESCKLVRGTNAADPTPLLAPAQRESSLPRWSPTSLHTAGLLCAVAAASQASGARGLGPTLGWIHGNR